MLTLRTFSRRLTYLEMSLSIRYQTATKSWTALCLPHITSHAHQKLNLCVFALVYVLLPLLLFVVIPYLQQIFFLCQCCRSFQLNVLKLWHATQWHPVECMQILAFYLNSFLYRCAREFSATRWNWIKMWKNNTFFSLSLAHNSERYMPLNMSPFFSFMCAVSLDMCTFVPLFESKTIYD